MRKNASLVAVLFVGLLTRASAGVDPLTGEASVSNELRDSGPVTALMTASAYGELGEMQKLLTHGADVNGKTNDGETALMFAARYGRPGAVQLLLDHHANPNVQTDNGKNTALILACSWIGPGELYAMRYRRPYSDSPEVGRK